MVQATIFDDVQNDPGSSQPDAHGQAAMFLVESLIHDLIARSVISVPEAVEIVEGAAEVAAEIEDDRRHSRSPARSSVTLLEAISQSLKYDLSLAP